ncbi:COASY [Mytilus coruscus]|uniref:COASY n=1 Tax=Mytilus coruscus TaxID=42192 RepID=A0A6J8A4S0_MYTCO|nr:COASY [Mytilus coruscus]
MLLGIVINPIKPNISIPRSPYVIGLRGGRASDKSALCGRLEKLGAGVVDSDRLGHEVYLKGTPCYNTLVEQFCDEIVGKNGEIQRRVLESIAFSNQEKLQLLNSTIRCQLEQSRTLRIVICFPPGREVKKIIDRNNMTEEKANNYMPTRIANLWESFLHNIDHEVLHSTDW